MTRLNLKPIDLWNNRLPVCPYCGATNQPERGGADGETFQETCGECNKVYHRTTRMTVTFSTGGDCAANGQMPHRLTAGAIKHSPYHCTNCRAEFYDFQLADGAYPRLRADEYVMIIEPTKDNL